MERISSVGWNMAHISILHIPVKPLTAPGVVNVVKEHGQVTISRIRALKTAYVCTPIQVAQNLYHMYEALMAFITQELY